MPLPNDPIYLDYHSTTPVDAEVLDAMLPYFNRYYGNAASRSHSFGWQASEAVEMARQQIANAIGGRSEEIFFTSGATEGLNTIIKGLAESLPSKGKHIITVATEHQAVLDPLAYLSAKGFEITTLPVMRNGVIDPDQFKEAIRDDTIMVCIMLANNETGVIQEMQVFGNICRQKGIAFISDATQAVGKIIVNPSESGVDFMVFSAHKFYGPKGVGAVWMGENKKKFKPTALLHGGGHEKGMRAGTMNVPGIVGMGKALDIRSKGMNEEAKQMRLLRDAFENKVLREIEFAEVNGSVDHRLPTVSNLLIPYVDSQAVMTKFRSKLAISSGAACSSSDPKPSHVLLAMGLTAPQAKGSFRVSVGMPTTSDEILKASDLLISAVREYRDESPVWQMVKQGIDISGLV